MQSQSLGERLDSHAKVNWRLSGNTSKNYIELTQDYQSLVDDMRDMAREFSNINHKYLTNVFNALEDRLQTLRETIRELDCGSELTTILFEALDGREVPTDINEHIDFVKNYLNSREPKIEPCHLFKLACVLERAIQYTKLLIIFKEYRDEQVQTTI